MIETDRLILRDWRDADVQPFAAMGRDALVMAHLGALQNRAGTEAAIDRARRSQAQHGHCFWAIERRDDGAFLGFCGLRVGGHPATPVLQVLEIGWRLARAYWHQGYAREAAQASIDWGWAKTDSACITAWTVPANTASWGLMRRLGMTHRPALDFAHPAFAADHPLSAHIVYAIDRPRN